MAGARFGDVGVSLFVQGTSFGDVGVSLFVAGAIFGDVAMLSWQVQYLVKFGSIAGVRNVATFHTQCVSKARKITSANARVRDDQFGFGSFSDHARIMVESSAYCK